MKKKNVNRTVVVMILMVSLLLGAVQPALASEGVGVLAKAVYFGPIFPPSAVLNPANWAVDIYLPASVVKKISAKEDAMTIGGIIGGGLTLKAPFGVSLPVWVIASSISLNMMRVRRCSDSGKNGIVVRYGLFALIGNPTPANLLFVCRSQ